MCATYLIAGAGAGAGAGRATTLVAALALPRAPDAAGFGQGEQFSRRRAARHGRAAMADGVTPSWNHSIGLAPKMALHEAGGTRARATPRTLHDIRSLPMPVVSRPDGRPVAISAREARC